MIKPMDVVKLVSSLFDIRTVDSSRMIIFSTEHEPTNQPTNQLSN